MQENKNLNNLEFGLGVENGHIYLGHFEAKNNDRVFVPDSTDMTYACLSVVSLLLHKRCIKNGTEVLALPIKNIGTLQFWSENFVKKFVSQTKEGNLNES